MAVFELTFRAETLDFDQNVTVLLPEPENLALAETGKPFRGELPVLYLLHGYSDDHTSWLRRSSIERYLTMDSTRPLICVCPSVQNSFYTDMEYGWKYYTYLTEELPRLLSRWIRISSKPEDTFIAGLSMGGYGAYKIALSHPERFAAAASFSGVLDIAKSGRDNPARDGAAYNVFGKNRSELTGTPHDIYRLLDEAIASGKPLPQLYASCGTADSLYANNLAFRDYITQKEGVDFTFFAQEGLAHEWAFWDSEVQKLLDWLPIREEC